MLSTGSRHGAIPTTLPLAPPPASRGLAASVIRLAIQVFLAGAAIALVVRTGWPMPPEATLVLGIGLVLWLVASFAAEPAP